MPSARRNSRSRTRRPGTRRTRRRAVAARPLRLLRSRRRSTALAPGAESLPMSLLGHLQDTRMAMGKMTPLGIEPAPIPSPAEAVLRPMPTPQGKRRVRARRARAQARRAPRRRR